MGRGLHSRRHRRQILIVAVAATPCPLAVAFRRAVGNFVFAVMTAEGIIVVMTVEGIIAVMTIEGVLLVCKGGWKGV